MASAPPDCNLHICTFSKVPVVTTATFVICCRSKTPSGVTFWYRHTQVVLAVKRVQCRLCDFVDAIEVKRWNKSRFSCFSFSTVNRLASFTREFLHHKSVHGYINYWSFWYYCCVYRAARSFIPIHMTPTWPFKSRSTSIISEAVNLVFNPPLLLCMQKCNWPVGHQARPSDT